MSVLDLMEDAWSGNMKSFNLEPPSARSASLSSSSALTMSPVDSPRSTLSGLVPVMQPPAPVMGMKPTQLCAVHRISPLHTFNANNFLLDSTKLAHKATGEEEAPFRVLQFAKPAAFAQGTLAPEHDLRKAGSSTIPIPGIRPDKDLGQRTSLIKAVPGAPSKPMAIRPQPKSALAFNRVPAAPMPAAAPPKGSWTTRQNYFPVGQPEKQPPGLTRALKAKTAAVKARAAKQSSSISARETSAEDLAWRFRFKKKWIREELYARKMEFPDDPGYEDEWEDAQKLIETCGYRGALQVAFLELPAKRGPNLDSEDFEFENADSLLFGEVPSDDEGSELSSRSSSVCSEVAAKAATLVRLQSKARTLGGDVV